MTAYAAAPRKWLRFQGAVMCDGAVVSAPAGRTRQAFVMQRTRRFCLLRSLCVVHADSIVSSGLFVSSIVRKSMAILAPRIAVADCRTKLLPEQLVVQLRGLSHHLATRICMVVRCGQLRLVLN